jgi:DNA-binding transcriptional MocR family regulator
VDTESLSRLVAGLSISHVAEARDRGIVIHFADGACLIVQRDGDGVTATFRREARKRTPAQEGQPSARQREYLQFIVRYLSRFGISPAEADISQHFMVSAPSVNQMMRTLERRGYITRKRDFSGQAIPRSIRVVVDMA